MSCGQIVAKSYWDFW